MKISLRSPHLSLTGCILLSGLSACAPMPASKSSPTKSNAVAAVASAPGGELLGRSTFKDDQTLPWMPLFLEPATGDTRVENGSLCARIEHPGKNAWDVQLRHREMTIKK